MQTETPAKSAEDRIAELMEAARQYKEECTAEISNLKKRLKDAEGQSKGEKDVWVPNGSKIAYPFNIDLFSDTQYIG